MGKMPLILLIVGSWTCGQMGESVLCVCVCVCVYDAFYLLIVHVYSLVQNRILFAVVVVVVVVVVVWGVGAGMKQNKTTPKNKTNKRTK